MAEATRPEGVPADAVDISDDGGLCKKILVEGDAAEGTPFEGAKVQVHYVGTLMNGEKFDSSRDRPGNFSFTLGRGQVIKGWDKGVATMHKGEKAELYCRADYAYGESGSPPKIPGNATLKFEVELLSWAEPVKERWEFSASEKIAKAKELKAEGGAEFKAGNWAKANDKYAEAAGWVEQEYDFVGDEQQAEARELLVPCLLNSAQCALKQSDWPAAVASCTKVLGQAALADASRVKALFRRGLARIKVGDFAEARTDLKEACTLDPKSKEIREAYASIKEAEAAAKRADAGLFSKMIKGAGGVKRKPPEGVPADAVDISDDGGLCKKILVEGDAAEGTPFEGAKVQVHYVGTLMNGEKFDSSRDRPGNFSFTLGRGQVIKGWDKGVATMHKGEKAELYCRADYAYGESGSPPKIPGNATLKFEVELLSWGADEFEGANGDGDDEDDEDASMAGDGDEPAAIE